MKNSMRVLLALMLVFAMLFAAGCGSDSAKPEPTKAPAADTDTTTPATDEGGKQAPVEPAATKAPLNFDSSVSTTTVDDYGWIALDCGYDYTMALQKDGALCGWGRNNYGQVGSGTYKDECVMAVQPVLTGITSISTGEYHSCAISTDGKMYIWGNNHSGRLGDGTTGGRSTPTLNSTLEETGEQIVQLAPGTSSTFAISADGTLYAFGANAKGQLGVVSENKNKEELKPIAVLENVKAVYSAGEFSYAIKNDGSLWVTGSNKKGQLGMTTEDKTVSVWTELTTISDVASFALGEEFALALKNDGTVWAVGSNKNGQLGIGSDEKTVETWTQVTDGAASVFAGVDTAGCVKTDGTLYLWGNNKAGQIGDGTTENKNAPVQVLTDVASADCGASHGAALKTDGSIWTWGNNKYFQLCDGTTADSLTPKMVVTNATAEAPAEEAAETPVEEAAETPVEEAAEAPVEEAAEAPAETTEG